MTPFQTLIRTHARDGLNRLASGWWAGADPGRDVVVTIHMSVPTHRPDEQVLDLFESLTEPFSGGYRRVVEVRSDVP